MNLSFIKRTFSHFAGTYSISSIYCGSGGSRIPIWPLLLIAVFFSGEAVMLAQAPGLLWQTNVGARVFAIDSATNVYASASNLVLKLSPTGNLLQTFTLTNRPGVAQRDSSGNLYYAGTYPAFYNGSGYDYSTNPSCFLITYDSSGQIIRTLNFGPSSFIRKIVINDVQVDSVGNCYVAYTYNVATYDHTDGAVKVDPTGALVWSINLPKHYNPSMTTVGTAHFGPVTPTNAYALAISIDPYGTFGYVSSIDQTGGVAQISDSLCSADWATDRPVAGPRGVLYSFDDTTLTKRNSDGSIIWSNDFGTRTKGTICGDGQGGVMIMDNGGTLQRFHSTGALIWTTNYASLLNGMVVDASGNRFLSMNDGRVARLANELTLAPFISDARFTPSGFRITVVSLPNLVWNVFGGTNIANWDLLGTVTNTSGQVQFTDPAALGMSRRFYKAQPVQ